MNLGATPSLGIRRRARLNKVQIKIAQVVDG